MWRFRIESDLNDKLHTCFGAQWNTVACLEHSGTQWNTVAWQLVFGSSYFGISSKEPTALIADLRPLSSVAVGKQRDTNCNDVTPASPHVTHY
jgi:hypothetical protein